MDEQRGPGRPYTTQARAWLDHHAGEGATYADAAALFRRKPSTIQSWAKHNRRPKPGTLVPGKKPRGKGPGRAAKVWAKKRCPEVRWQTVRALAKHFGVTDATVHRWIRLDIPPRTGGYPRGEMQRLAAPQRIEMPRPVQKAKPPPAPAGPMTPGRRQKARELFVAELYERRRSSLTRIFTAEIRA